VAAGAVFKLIRATLLPTFVRSTAQRNRVTILVYHDPSPEVFDAHLTKLRQRYSIVPLRQFVSGDPLPTRPLVITLDDGHRGNAALGPVLQKHGIPATIFICSGIVGTARGFWFKHVTDPGPLKLLDDGERLAALRDVGYADDTEFDDREALDDGEIARLREALVDFQSHTVTHPILPRCAEPKANDEIARSRRELAERFGLDIYAIAYPNGDYAPRDLELARRAGYTCGLTEDAGFNTAATDRFRLRRISVADSDGVDAVLVKASGVWSVVRRLLGR
jgi:peptidoglycan/xylan/chitin deacetylase (PgdA/CDA1 family)